MIAINRVGTKLRVELETSYPLSNTYYFHHDTGEEDFAKLLQVHFLDKLNDTVVAIRKEEYERGYKDGRSKKTKTSWFTCLFKTGTY